MRTETHRAAQRGITLIELMVVVAIVAILGTVAAANYRSQALRSNRAEGKSALLRLQAQQEKFYLTRHTYTTNLTDLQMTATTERGLYTLQVNLTNGGDGYRAVASAAGSQVVDTECPTFSITETGIREPATGRCWQ